MVFWRSDDLQQLEEALSRGYAVVASDMGHSGAPNNWLFMYANLQAVVDFAYRATHVVTIAAKEVVAAYYGTAPRLSYFNGCSTGGRQAIVEASRYPEDFDGIIAGAAANPKAHLDAWRIWMAQVMFASAETVVPPL